MDLKKIISVGLAALSLAACLASCSNGSEDSDVTEHPLVAETAEPIADELRNDYTDDEELRETVQALRDSFADMAQTPAAAFSYVLENGAVTVTKYNGEADAVRVPATIDGAPVVAIADAAFAENTTLKALYLPDSVQTLGEGILTGCNRLQSLRTACLGATASADGFLGYLFGAAKYADNPIAIPSTLVYLELGAMQSLPDFALFDCNDLVCITLPASMKALGTYSLYNCSSLQAINTEHLQILGEHALDSCRALTVLELGEGVTKIGIGALEGCSALRNLVLPFVGGGTKETSYLGYLFGAEVPEFSKGYYPPYLTRVTLLSTCTRLEANAFLDCAPLLAVELPDTLTSVGIRAFAGCVRLAELELPALVASVGDNAFFGCLGLVRVTFAEGSVLTSLGVNAFYNCSALKAVDLPQSLKALPSSCFAGCLSLERANLGGVMTVGKNAFRHCQSLTALTVQPSAVFEDGNAPATRLLESEN